MVLVGTPVVAGVALPPFYEAAAKLIGIPVRAAVGRNISEVLPNSGLKRVLGLQRCGNSTETFLRDALAPLVVAPMATYLELKATVIDRLP